VFLLHIVVCVKQVPDTKIIKVNPKTNTLDRRGVPAILNPYDGHAVEEAVRIKEQVGGKVTVLSMGPPQATDVIKKCIEIGADAGYLITDRRFAGADTLATSYALYNALEKISKDDPIDLVLCGLHAIDGDTGQVGPGIARRLNIPPVTKVIKVEEVSENGKYVKVHRKIEDGYEVIQAQLPCLITVEKEINDISYSPLPNMIKAARYEPVIWTVDDFEGVDIAQLGLKGSPTVVGKMWAPQPPEKAKIIEGSPADQVKEIVSTIFAEKSELFQQ